jgi:hypothetical protein
MPAAAMMKAIRRYSPMRHVLSSRMRSSISVTEILTQETADIQKNCIIHSW